jgi:ribosomal protein L11 methyltransferase
MCLALINRYADSYQEETCLDIGCGSGILSLAAVQLGLRTVVGLDIDPQAIAVATQNAMLNALHERVQFLQGSWEVVRGMLFAMMTANIYLGPLIEMMQPLVRCLGAHGTLILSGIVEHQEATLHVALQKAGLQVVSRLAEEGWIAVAAQRLPLAHELRDPAS